MKHFVLTLLVAMLGVVPCVASSLLILHLTDGTNIVCNLAKEPKMTFGEKTLTLSSLEGTVGQWDFTQVESWSFGEDDAIESIKAEKAQINIEDGLLTMAGVDAKKVAVYDINGRLVTPKLNTKGTTTSVSLNGLPKGTYVLKVGKSSVKFLVK